MTFDDILEQVIALLKRQGRVSYRAIKLRFDIDDDYIEGLKDELIYAHQMATDEDNRVLVWAGDAEGTLEPATQPDEPEFQPVVEQTQPVQPTSTSVEPHTPDAERRQLTVIFCDLVGSTSLSGQMDAEDYREVVRAYQTTCGGVIQRFDCHTAQTLGDGLLVYSGYPVAHENDAERAVRVGLGILDAMKTLNERLEDEKGIRLAVRVGIHTGPVVIGGVGAGDRQEQLALGEVPNVAARIQGLAEPDTVVISSDTYRLIQGYFDCESLGERELRGVAEPIAVHRVLQESGVQGRLDIAGGRGLTPLVGREQEVGLLRERWEQAREGRGQVVLLSGEAGIGKSRLVQALKEHAAEGVHTRMECRSSPYFTNSALYPIIDMVQRTLRFQADDVPETKLDKLEQNLRQSRLPLEETVPLFGAFLSLPVPEDRYPALDLTPQRQRQKTLESIVSIIQELSERQPVLFILEDAHWLDASTTQLLDLLIEQVPTSQILTLITYRPEFQPTWGNRSYLSQLTLNRLSREGIAQMATQVAGGNALPSEVLQQLVEKTDGVPLYVEEMTKALLESGALKEGNGQYELSGPISSLAIPATLQDSLMSRLDRLMTAKVIAQLGATIGRQFGYELLCAVAQLDEPTLQRELERLVEAELVYQRGLPPNAIYTFKHALVQDAAYDSLLRSTRQGYHRRIAEVLTERFSETAEHQPELLAHHYTEAGLPEQAVNYWYQAGHRADERSANLEAIAHFTKGLGLLQTLPDTDSRMQHELRFNVDLGKALMMAKGYGAPEAGNAYARARELCQQIGETPNLAPALVGLWAYYFGCGEHRTAREMGDQLLKVAQHINDSALLLLAHRALGITLFYLGKLKIAHAHLEQGVTLYDPHQHDALALSALQNPGVTCLCFSARTLWYLGFPDQARKRCHEGLMLAQQVAHPFSLAFAQCFAAHVHQFHREERTVQEQAAAAVTFSRERDFAFYTDYGTILFGWSLAAQGQAKEGIALMRQGIAQASGTVVAQPYFLALLAEGYAKATCVEEGLQTLAAALEFVDSRGERDYESELYRLKGALLLQQSAGHTTEAEACYLKAIDIARNQQAKSLELRVATSLARLWQSQNRSEEAYDLLALVYNWFTEGHDTADLIDAKALLVELEEGR